MFLYLYTRLITVFFGLLFLLHIQAKHWDTLKEDMYLAALRLMVRAAPYLFKSSKHPERGTEQKHPGIKCQVLLITLQDKLNSYPFTEYN